MSSEELPKKESVDRKQIETRLVKKEGAEKEVNALETKRKKCFKSSSEQLC